MEIAPLITHLRALAPEETAMDGDPVGMLIESSSETVSSLVVCLDATSAVVNFAIERSAELLIAHHPLIYHPLRKLERADPIARVAMDLVRAGIGLYAMHTNWDLAKNGINDTLALTLSLTMIQPLANQPIARIGTLHTSMSADAFLDHVQSSLICTGTSVLRHFPTSFTPKPIKTVAVCGGAGGDFLGDAIAAGADAFVTSDIDHDQFIEAVGRGLLLIDAGHYATEAPGMEVLAKTLQSTYPALTVQFCPNW
jgi:dinuclear metal center YbgI/SA1388 family protein